MTRDHNYEQDCLDHIIYKAGMRGPGGDMFRRLCLQRLDHGKVEYGDDNFWKIGFSSVVKEAREEAIDQVSWLLGAMQVLRDMVREGHISEDHFHAISSYMVEASMRALEAFQLLETASAIFRDSGAEDAAAAKKTAA